MNFLDFRNRFCYTIPMQIISHIPQLFEQKKQTARAFEKWCTRKGIEISYDTARRAAGGDTSIRLYTAVLVSDFLGVDLGNLFEVNAPQP